MASKNKTVGYAVVGLGALSQSAVLPAFAHAKRSHLVALVTGDIAKGKRLSEQFEASHVFSYDQFSSCLELKAVEAIYIATPNGEHEKYATAAANAGKHVICEKPLAATVDEARRMVDACRRNHVLLMTAYRKYFDPCTLRLKDMIVNGELGRIDVIHTLFSEFRSFGDNSPAWFFDRRLSGGGPLIDLGIYCLNTSRWLAGEDPFTASAISWARDPRRYAQVEEGISFRLDFPSGLIVQGTSSYSGVFSSFLHVHGEKGWIEVAPVFAFEEGRRMSGKVSGRWFSKTYKPIDEFALELDHFSTCIRQGKDPVPDGKQGLRDMAIIEAIYRSAKERTPAEIHY